MGNNLYSNLVNFYNINDENFKEFMANLYKEMLTTHRDVQYVKEHLTEEIEKKLEIYLVDGKFNINIEEKVNEFLENNQEIKDITAKLTTNTNNIENITSQLDTNTDKILENKHLVNVLSLGVKNDGSVDCTDIIHKALAEGKPLYFPNGTYLLEYIELNANNILIGESESSTILKPNTSTKPAFIYIGLGVCNHVRFENFIITKSPNHGQIGIDIRANFPSEGYQHGGLWDSIFRNIYLTGAVESSMWNGIGMRISGSGDNSLLPIQLNIFEKVNIWSNNKLNINNIPLIIEGQVEQNLFNRCTFSGADNEKEITNLNSTSGIFRRRRADGGSIEGDQGGGANTFTQCYFGNNSRCLSFERSWNPTFINCYYENARQFINIGTTSTATIIGGAFLNVAGETNLIVSDYSKNKLNLNNLNLTGTISCRGANILGCDFKNTMFDETACTSSEISFMDQYSIIHFNHSETEITINSIIPSNIIESYNEFYLRIPIKDGKTINFSSSGGNIYNDLTLDISSKSYLIKATKIPYLYKYKLEII